jgi:hypothetical protein
MLRFRVSGPHKNEFDGSIYYIVGGTTKHHTERVFHSTNPFHKGPLTKIKIKNVEGMGGRKMWGI